MVLKMVRPDSKGRVTLGAIAKGISSFSIRQERNGTIVLQPFVEIPAREKWLFGNTSASQKVQTGLDQAKNRELVDKGSFSKFADNEIG